MPKIDFRQLPEDGDSVALDVYIEGPLQELDTDEEFEFLSEELNFDEDEALADKHVSRHEKLNGGVRPSCTGQPFSRRRKI